MTNSVTFAPGLAAGPGLTQCAVKRNGGGVMRKITIVLAAVGWCLGTSITALAQDAAVEPASGCTIHSRTSDEVHAIVDEFGYDFAGYDALCARLDAENMGLFFSESYGEIGDRSLGLVMVRLYDRSTVTLGRGYSSSIALSADLGEDAPQALLMHAINVSLTEIATNPDTYVESVHTEIALFRTVMGGQ